MHSPPAVAGLTYEATEGQLQIRYAIRHLFPRFFFPLILLLTLALAVTTTVLVIAFPLSHVGDRRTDVLLGVSIASGIGLAWMGLAVLATSLVQLSHEKFLARSGELEINSASFNLLIPAGDIRSISTSAAPKPRRSFIDVVVASGTLRLDHQYPTAAAEEIAALLSSYFGAGALPAVAPIVKASGKSVALQAAMVVAGVLCCVWLGISANLVHWGLGTWSWRATPATVLYQEFEETADKLTAKLTYEYKVAGEIYRCDRIALQINPDGAKALVLDHPVGSTLPIYYDPANPREATVIRGVGPFIWGMAFALIPGCFWILKAFRWPAKEQAEQLQKYRKHSYELGENRRVLAEWKVPADLVHFANKAIRREFWWITARTSLASVVSVIAIVCWLGDVLEPRVRNALVWIAFGMNGILALNIVASYIIPSSIRIQLSTIGIERGEKKIRWKHMKAFSVREDFTPRPHQVLLIYVTGGPPRAYALPDSPQAAEILALVAGRLPVSTEPPLPPKLRSDLPKLTWLGVGCTSIASGVILALSSPDYFMHPRQHHFSVPLILVAVLIGPAVWVAVAWRNRRRADTFALLLVLGFQLMMLGFCLGQMEMARRYLLR